MARLSSRCILLLLLSANFATALQFGWKVQDVPESTTVHGQSSMENIEHLHIQLNLQQRLEESHSIMQSYRSLPPCQKVATAALMHSCSTPIEKQPEGHSDPSHGLDMIASKAGQAYSAGLAVCELLEAQATIPPQCEAFVPNEQNTKHRVLAGRLTDPRHTDPITLYPDYEHLVRNHVDQCITALEQRPQSWSSYTNAKQNAVAICQSFQAVLQNEQIVATGKKIIANMGAVSDLYLDAAQQFEGQITELRNAAQQILVDIGGDWRSLFDVISRDAKGFAEASRQQLVAIVNDASNANSQNQHMLYSRATDMAIQISAATDRYVDHANNIEQRLGFVDEKIKQDLMQHLGKVMQEAGLQHDLILTNHQALDELAQAIHRTAANLTDKLEQADAIADSVNENMSKILQDAQNLEKTIRYVIDTFGIGWIAMLGKVLVLVACIAVFTPLTFGFWEKFVGLSFTGNWSAAFATATVIGLTAAIYLNPATFFTESSSDVFQDDLSAWQNAMMWLLIGVVATLSVMKLYRTPSKLLAATRDHALHDDAEEKSAV